MKGICIFILSLILVFSMVACTNSNTDSDQDPILPVETEDEKEKDVEEDSEEADNQEPQEEPGNDVDETNEVSNKWPKDFMPEAPILDGDIVKSKEEGPKKYFLEFDDIDYDNAIDYVDAMKEAGFTKNVNEHSDTNIIKYKGMDEDNNLLIFIWNKKGITKLELIK